MAKNTLGKEPSKAAEIKKEAKSNTQTHSKVEVKCKTLTVNIFFDGTGNNFYNIETREKNPAAYAKLKGNKDYGSYFGGRSNVAHLFQSQPGRQADISWVYIDGIGTLREKVDDRIDGQGLGKGPTGIHARVDGAFDAIRKQVFTVHGENYCPSLLILNVFGFSRGAAAARHFVYLAKFEAKKRFKNWNLSNNLVLVKFVGLFDTVSSFHPTLSLMPDFDNDMTDKGENRLYLKFGQNYASHVFQITAADEYREYFSLTDITSAIDLGNGFEVAMSGAHSDIGGGYNNDDESREYFTVTGSKAATIRDWFEQQGFYTQKDMSYIPHRMLGYSVQPPQLICKRTVPNTYHKIPLKTMRLMAETFGFNLKFNPKLIEDREKTPDSVILKLRDDLSARVLAKAKRQFEQNRKWGMREDCRLEKIRPTQAKAVRHGYIHWSAQNSTGMHVHFPKGGTLPKRKVHKG